MLNSIHLANVDLNLLVLFDVVMREQHVGQAATALHLSPSAVSHGLARLRRLFDDPLFLRTPKGVVATDRATQLAEPIAEVLTRVSSVVASATPFDAARSTRRFTLGMADATAAVLVPALLAHTIRVAPFLDIGLRHLFPSSALQELESRNIDLAVVASEGVPARFAARTLSEEEFVIAARLGHPFLSRPTLKAYCEAGHVLASISGDPQGFVDELLAKQSLARRVALVVPSFMLALASVAETHLLTALPESLARAHAPRFGVAFVRSPLKLPRSTIRAIVPESALLDAGVAWLLDAVQHVTRKATPAKLRSRSPRARTSPRASRGGA